MSREFRIHGRVFRKIAVDFGNRDRCVAQVNFTWRERSRVRLGAWHWINEPIARAIASPAPTRLLAQSALIKCDLAPGAESVMHRDVNEITPSPGGRFERLRAALQRTAPFSRRERWILAIALAVVLIGPLCSHLYKALYRQRGDWYSIYTIADHSVRTGELWADPDEDIVRSQRYPPIARPLLMPLALAPKAVTAIGSFVLFTGLYLWCAAVLVRTFLPPPDAARAGRVIGVALLWAIVLPYLYADLVACNVTSVLLASVTGAYVLAARGKPIRAGLVLSIGVLLKMIPALCLLHFVVRRQWRVAWGTIAGVVLLGLIPTLVIFGPTKLRDYQGWWYRHEFAEFTPMRVIDDPIECTYQNQAVVRTLVRLLTHTNAGHAGDPFYITLAEPPRWVIKAVYFGIMGLSLVGLGATLWRTRRDDSALGAATSYALCVGAMLWFSPWAGSYYFSMAMWPAAPLLAAALDERRNRWPARIALGVWIVAMPTLASLRLRAYGATMDALFVLLAALAGYLIWAARRSEPPTVVGGRT